MQTGEFDCPPDRKTCPKPDGSGFYTITANENTCKFSMLADLQFQWVYYFDQLLYARI